MLKWVNPPFTAFTLQENWEELNAERYNLRDYWVAEDDLPEHLKLAAISSEDQRFWQHWGLDIRAIAQALDENEKNMKVKRRGASTVTQQVAKNLFLTPSPTYIRKGIEAVIALTIEFMWTKDRILEMYLNIAEFGPAIYGVGKASGEFFGKAPIGLTPTESAQLAAVLPNPKEYQAEPPTPFVEERSRWILRQMTYISGIAYSPLSEPAAPDSMLAADTTQTYEFTESTIQRAQIPDSLTRFSDRDPLLDDSSWKNSIEGW